MRRSKVTAPTFLALLFAFGVHAPAQSEIKLTASDGAPLDFFGDRYVDISSDGNTIVAGSSFDDDKGTNSGSVYVYERSGAGWMESAKLTASDGQAGDEFGWFLAISGDGNTIVVGAYASDDPDSQTGSAYIYVRDGGGWSEQAKLLASDRAAGDRFGWPVAINENGNTVAIGAVLDNDPIFGANTGSAYIFQRQPDMTWMEEAKLIASDRALNDQFGHSVAIDAAGDTVVVGAYLDDDGAANSGSGYVFQRSGGSWTEQAKVGASDPTAEAWLGVRVARISADGETFVLGAYGKDGGTGAAYVYQWNGVSWIQESKLTASDAALGDLFAIGGGISDDGNVIVLGSSLNDDDGDRSGSAYIFTRTSATWTEQYKITASDADPFDRFGIAGATTDFGTVVIGAWGDDDNGDRAGAAYVYEVDVLGPLTSGIASIPDPVPTHVDLTLVATVNDTSTGGSPIGSAEYRIDSGSFSPMFPQDGAFDEVSEDVFAIVPAFTEAGVHHVCVRGRDLAGNSGNLGHEECTFLVVYDPEAGFVTGGGWIDSPEGAYPADPTLTGKANFGFVSKYKRGTTTPIGATEFRFKAADLDFHSNHYEWLVVAGARAQFKGGGTINGEGSYGFMLTAIDGDVSDGAGVDRFRIRIWSTIGGGIVYDNQLGVDEFGNAATALGGGSIVIHAK